MGLEIEREARAAARRIAVLMGAVLLLSGAGRVTLAANNDKDAAALRASQAAIGHVLADYTLIDAHRRPLSVAALRGRPLVLSFVYTNCYDICSGYTLHLRDVVRVAREAMGPRSFSVLTVGFDVEHDDPRRMLAYGRDRGIVDADWHFATADAATIARMTDAAGFTWFRSPKGFDHITQFTIVDDEGRVVRQVYGQDFAAPDLVEPLKELALGRNLGRAPVRGILERVRLYCSVYDPATGKYRFDVAMLAGAIPALMVLGMVALALIMVGRRSR
jgi:protein SCO1